MHQATNWPWTYDGAQFLPKMALYHFACDVCPAPKKDDSNPHSDVRVSDIFAATQAAPSHVERRPFKSKQRRRNSIEHAEEELICFKALDKCKRVCELKKTCGCICAYSTRHHAFQRPRESSLLREVGRCRPLKTRSACHSKTWPEGPEAAFESSLQKRVLPCLS